MPPKPPKFKSKDAEWTEDLALYLKDDTLAKYVYEAIRGPVPTPAGFVPNFRLVVGGVVTYSRTAATPPPAYTPGAAILWPSKDMDWDDAGCLVIKDHRLGGIISDAKANGDPFKIEVPLAAIVPAGSGGGIGENKANAMCTC